MQTKTMSSSPAYKMKIIIIIFKHTKCNTKKKGTWVLEMKAEARPDSPFFLSFPKLYHEFYIRHISNIEKECGGVSLQNDDLKKS